MQQTVCMQHKTLKPTGPHPCLPRIWVKLPLEKCFSLFLNLDQLAHLWGIHLDNPNENL